MASPSRASDDGFHEIQLNGKQLVFLFMAVTVVSVVIFLCGVLVGRGARLDRDVLAGAAPGQSVALDAPPPVPVDATGNTSQPTPGTDGLSYPERLEARVAPAERLAEPAEPPAVKSEPVESPSARPGQGETRVQGDPGGGGVAVQVSAFRERREAEALAQRLIAKGFSAYLVEPAAGAPALFRVRVGRFKDRSEAARVAERLKREEQFEPWIVP